MDSFRTTQYLSIVLLSCTSVHWYSHYQVQCYPMTHLVSWYCSSVSLYLLQLLNLIAPSSFIKLMIIDRNSSYCLLLSFCQYCTLSSIVDTKLLKFCVFVIIQTHQPRFDFLQSLLVSSLNEKWKHQIVTNNDKLTSSSKAQLLCTLQACINS